MNSKILIAFIAGAVIASGIVYMAVKEDVPPRASAVSAELPRPAPPPAALPPATLPVAVTAPPAPAQLPLTPAPHREKRSPMPPPVSKQKPMGVARYQAPPPQPEPPPARDPSPHPDPLPPVEAQIPSEPAQPSPPPVVVSPQPQAPPDDVPPQREPQSPQSPQSNVAPTVTIAAGTLLSVRMGETISAVHHEVGDSFLATLDRQLVVDGWVIAEKGSRLEGRVVEAIPAGRASNISHLGIELVTLSTADGQRIQIRTQSYKKEGAGSPGNDVAKIATGAVLGTAIGAVAGGGKGAAIGAGIGTAAGVAGAVISHGKPVEIPVESRINFRITNPVTITERSN